MSIRQHTMGATCESYCTLSECHQKNWHSFKCISAFIDSIKMIAIELNIEQLVFSGFQQKFVLYSLVDKNIIRELNNNSYT